MLEPEQGDGSTSMVSNDIAFVLIPALNYGYEL